MPLTDDVRDRECVSLLELTTRLVMAWFAVLAIAVSATSQLVPLVSFSAALSAFMAVVAALFLLPRSDLRHRFWIVGALVAFAAIVVAVLVALA